MKSRNAVVSVATLLSAAGLALGQSFSEDFESGTIPATWTIHNQSNPIGTTQWGAGNNPAVPVHSGANAAYANYLNGAGLATLSDWMILPNVTLRNGDSLAFWTITDPAEIYPDRLQVRLSQAGASVNTGTTETDVGDFTTLLLDINPTYTTTGYPGVNTLFRINLSGLPGAGVSGRLAFRYFVENGGPSGANSDVINVDDVAYTSVTDPAAGACCFPDGGCSMMTSAVCSGSGGTFSGPGVTCAAANCPQPATGACCSGNGTCSVLTQVACTTAGGTWAGANVTCAAANCQPSIWAETGDAGDTPGTAQDTVGGTGNSPLRAITGSIGASGDADVYVIKICDHANFLATTANTTPPTSMDTQLFLFDSTGHGVVMDDDDVNVSNTLQSRITSQFVTADGNYFLGISSFDSDPQDASAAYIWNDQNNSLAYGPEWQPNGPAAANAWAGFDHGTSGAGNYTIALTGACFHTASSQPCYANCDQSTSPPILNANDFQCFLNKYAANDTYANCDHSTNPPTLNANDFQCFLNAYAAGCT